MKTYEIWTRKSGQPLGRPTLNFVTASNFCEAKKEFAKEVKIWPNAENWIDDKTTSTESVIYDQTEFYINRRDRQ